MSAVFENGINFELHVRSCQNALLPAPARARVWMVVRKNPMVNVEGDGGTMEEGFGVNEDKSDDNSHSNHLGIIRISSLLP